MPSIEEGIFGLLNARAEIKAVLPPPAGDINCRLYPGHIAEEATLPAAAFARAGGRRQLTQSGPDGLIRARFQFTVASSDQSTPNGSGYDDCVTALDAIIGVLHGYAGQLPNGVIVQQISQASDCIDDFDIETRLYARHCDFEVIYEDPSA